MIPAKTKMKKPDGRSKAYRGEGGKDALAKDKAKFAKAKDRKQTSGNIKVSMMGGGAKETIVDNKTGFLFKNGSPESLAEHINNIIEMDKDKLQSIGNEGRKNILKKFDVEQMCNSTFIEYKKLIK